MGRLLLPLVGILTLITSTASGLQTPPDIKWAPSYYASKASYPRDYHRPLTQDEVDDIRFIITTLADKPVVKLWPYKAALERAGDRVKHVHPLVFLRCIFADEELKVAIRNVRRKSLAWDHFVDGVTSSLEDEHQRANVAPEHVADFAGTLCIEVGLILPTIENSDWIGLIEDLIQHVPRKGDHGRYDM